MKNDVLYFPFFAGNQPSSLTGGTSGGSDSPSSSEGFVVQRGRTVPTLTNIDSKSDKEQHNKDTKSEELGETSGGEKDVFQQMKNIPVAGRPSETNVTPRRASKQFSRRNSVDDNASTLSLENFGGSQVNIGWLQTTKFIKNTQTINLNDLALKKHSYYIPDISRLKM